MKILKISAALIAALMTASCETYNVSDNSPHVKIPDLPENVYGKETPLPKISKNMSQTEIVKVNRRLLKTYRLNERHNLRAIESAHKHNSNLQRIYSKEPLTNDARWP